MASWKALDPLVRYPSSRLGGTSSHAVVLLLMRPSCSTQWRAVECELIDDGVLLIIRDPTFLDQSSAGHYSMALPYGNSPMVSNRGSGFSPVPTQERSAEETSRSRGSTSERSRRGDDANFGRVSWIWETVLRLPAQQNRRSDPARVFVFVAGVDLATSEGLLHHLPIPSHRVPHLSSGALKPAGWPAESSSSARYCANPSSDPAIIVSRLRD
nr:hypothetical protein CFP56_70490 [Quercus suber]